LEGVVCIAEDTRERREFVEMKRLNEDLKATQAQLIQSGKLASIGELATGIAHEINQPLTYISTHVQLLCIDLAQNIVDAEKIRDTLKSFSKRIERITVIIQHLRTLGREQDVAFDNVQLPTVLSNTLLLLAERLRLNNIELIKEWDKQLPPVKGNAYQLEQVLINLFQNSIDALEGQKGGIITVKISHLPQQQKTQILFSDNGPGVTEDQQEHIFDPFYTTKPEGRGTGLGLSISFGIIQDHNGTIKVESSADSGTTFIITLPRGQAQM